MNARPIFDADRFRASFEALLERLGEGFDDARGVLLLEDLLLQLSEQRPAEAQLPPVERAAREWLSAVRAHLGARWSGAQEAHRRGVSPAHWRRVVKSVAGLPLESFVLQSRLDAAASALRTGDEPVKAIAARCGLEDVAYFSRRFKEQHGSSPAVYRREAQLQRS